MYPVKVKTCYWYTQGGNCKDMEQSHKGSYSHQSSLVTHYNHNSVDMQEFYDQTYSPFPVMIVRMILNCGVKTRIPPSWRGSSRGRWGFGAYIIRMMHTGRVIVWILITHIHRRGGLRVG